MGPNWMCNNAKCYVVWQNAVCVDCQWCFIVEGTDCYCILYILTVTVYRTISTTSSQLDTAHCTHCMQMLLLLNCLFSQPYNIEGLETPHGCLSHSFLLQRGVCVIVQSVCIHTVVCTWKDGWLCISSCTDPWSPCVTACNTFAFHCDTNSVHSSALQ